MTPHKRKAETGAHHDPEIASIEESLLSSARKTTEATNPTFARHDAVKTLTLASPRSKRRGKAAQSTTAPAATPAATSATARTTAAAPSASNPARAKAQKAANSTPAGSGVWGGRGVSAGKRGPGLVVIALIIAGVVVLGLAGALGYLLFNGGLSGGGNIGSVLGSSDGGLVGQEVLAPTAEEIRMREAVAAGADANDPNVLFLPTPVVASYGDLLIHSPIVPKAITEVEFHQASYDTALRLTPMLTIVDAQKVAQKHGTTHIPYDQQPTGDESYVGQAVSTWRMDSVGDEMTSVDVGAKKGTVAYAPVSGTVVKIKKYSLFGQIDDYEMHIQSPDHPELDVVVLHITKLKVKVGDEVIGGCTPIAKVRNIGDVIDNNLMNFTKPGDPGNHCHVQVNDATRPDYKGLEGALDIFGGQGFVKPEAAAPTTPEVTVTR